jgi:hypothetical protein
MYFSMASVQKRSIDDKALPVKLTNIPFKELLSQITVISSLGAGLSLVASVTVAPATSFLGRTDNSTATLIANTTIFYTWATSAYTIAVVLTIAAQIVMTTPLFERSLLSYDEQYAKNFLRLFAYLALFFTVAGIGLTGEALKAVDQNAGAMLQWSLLPIITLAVALAYYAQRSLCKHCEWNHPTGGVGDD